jgi:hypothetical protein
VLEVDEVEPQVVEALMLEAIDERENVSVTILLVVVDVLSLLDDDEVELVDAFVFDDVDVFDEVMVVDVVDEIDAMQLYAGLDDDEEDEVQVILILNDEIEVNELYIFLIVVLVRLIFNDEIVVLLVIHIKSTDLIQIENSVFYKEDRLFCAVFLLKILNNDIFEYIQNVYPIKTTRKWKRKKKKSLLQSKLIDDFEGLLL